MRTIALVTTNPISNNNPIIEGSPKALPVTARPTKAPIAASGKLNRITNGFLNEPRLPTITKYTRIILIAIAKKISRNPSSISAKMPPDTIETPGFRFSIIKAISLISIPTFRVSSAVISPLIVADLRPSVLAMVIGVSC